MSRKGTTVKSLVWKQLTIREESSEDARIISSDVVKYTNFFNELVYKYGHTLTIPLLQTTVNRNIEKYCKAKYGDNWSKV